MTPDEETRFWKKVIKGPAASSCWLWVGAIGDDGYGRYWTQTETGTQRMLRAHRAAAEIIHGHTLTHGYDQHQVDELVRGIIMTGQIPLF